MYTATLYTGNGGTQSVTTLANMNTDGGLLWIKRRETAGYSHALFDTARGSADMLSTDLTSASAGGHPISITSTGFTITSSSTTNYNANTASYVAWSFKKAPKFFDLSAVTKTAGSNATVSFPDLGEIGMVFVKRTDSTGSWYTWHKDMTAGNLMVIGAAEAAATHFSVSGTTITLTNGVISDGSYVVYAWAHDSAANGNIFCGSMANALPAQTITIGWEPQYFIYAGTANGGWPLTDTARGFNASNQKFFYVNGNQAEASYSNQPYPTATGVYWTGGLNSKAYFIAIRKP